MALLQPVLTTAAQPKPKPNIVLILADDLGWADLGCYGNKFNETPNIDRLAGQGVKFTQFYAAGPVCSPTRASIMSGQYQARFGLTAHIHGHWKPFEKLAEPPCALFLPTNVTSIATRLSSDGYATALVGKWHLEWKGLGTPAQHGFQTVEEFGGHTVPAAKNRGKTGPQRAAAYIAERATKFIGDHTNQPFFLYVCPQAVHIPLSTTPELEKKYRAKKKVDGYSCNPLYAGLLEELDDCVGRIVQGLEKTRLADNTLLIFTSDNGGLEREVGGWPGTLNRPLRNEKGSLYEGGIRVPCIVRWPGQVPKGAVTHELACTTDFYPTFLNVAKIPLPGDHLMDGQSLLSVVSDPDKHVKRDPLFWHYPHYHHSRPSGALRMDDLKGIEFFDTGEFELYNLAEDIGETNNLAATTPSVSRALRERLHAWQRRVNAQMPRENPAYDPQRLNEWWNRATVTPTEPPGAYHPDGKSS